METETIIIMKGIIDTIICILAFVISLCLAYRLGFKEGYRKCNENQKELYDKKHKKSIFIDIDKD